MPNSLGLTTGAQGLLRAIQEAYETNFNQPVRLGGIVTPGLRSSTQKWPFLLELKRRGFIKTSWGGHSYADTLIEPMEVL